MILSLFLVASGCALTWAAKEPMVAFICNKPAMYHTSTGWSKDDSTDCINQPSDILEYCKKKYPSLDVTNVMEATDAVTIAGWCKRGENECDHSQHTIHPFKCLVGEFQSEPLLVPEHCMFDHVHDDAICASEPYWKGRAYELCKSKSKMIQSNSMLAPCGTDRFAGVEFVCCPNKNAAATTMSPNTKIEKTFPELNFTFTELKEEKPLSSDLADLEEITFGEDDDEEMDWKDAITETPGTTQKTVDTAQAKMTAASAAVAESETLEFDEESDESSYYDDADFRSTSAPKPAVVDGEAELYEKYMHGQDVGKFNNEHELYEAVMTNWKASYQRRQDTLMSEWNATKEKVGKLQKSDPRGYKRMLHDVTQKFQESYAALQSQGEAEKTSLLDRHDQHVQNKLNLRKQKTMTQLLHLMQVKEPDMDSIIDHVEKVIRLEQQDREHTMNYYTHLREQLPVAADRILPEIQQRLRLISGRIDQTVEMLEKLPEPLYKQVKPEINSFLAAFTDLQQSSDIMLRFQPGPKPTGSPREVPLEKESEVFEPIDLAIESSEEGGSDLSEIARKLEERPVNSKVQHEMGMLASAKSTVTHLAAGPQAFVIAIVAAAGLLVVVVGALLLHRRSSRNNNYQHYGRVNVSTSITPEERHVASMQVSGYENPTYKYFETATA